MYRSDTTIVLNDILHELTMMRQLMEWDKAEYLRRQAEAAASAQQADAEAQARKEQEQADMMAMNEAILAKGAELAKKAQLEAARQAYEEHVAMHHRTGNIPSA